MSRIPAPDSRTPGWPLARWVMLLLALALAGCAGLPGPFAPAPLPDGEATPPASETVPEKAAFEAVLSGAEAVPANRSTARGRLVAVLDTRTGLLRWKLQVEGLGGTVRRAAFHSPGMSGEVAPQVLSLGVVEEQGLSEGRAQLTPRQQRDLLAGQWYVNLPTEAYPDGELRGQLVERR